MTEQVILSVILKQSLTEKVTSDYWGYFPKSFQISDFLNEVLNEHNQKDKLLLNKFKKVEDYLLDGLFLLSQYKLSMSKRYSGKSFKDSSVAKKPKLSLKEKRQLKKEKAKKS